MTTKRDSAGRLLRADMTYELYVPAPVPVAQSFGGLGRFAGPWLLILASLADGPKHGYVIMTDVACFSGVSIAADRAGHHRLATPRRRS